MQERVDSLSPDARANYWQHGDLEAAEKLAKPPDVTPESSPDKQPESESPDEGEEVQTEAASGPATKETEQPKPQTRQDRNWAATRKELADARHQAAVLQAKLELLERERAGTGPSAPGTEQEPDGLPELPNIGDYLDTEGAKYTKDLNAAVNARVKAMVESALQGVEKTKQLQGIGKSWSEQKAAAAKKYKDFESAIGPEKLQVSLAAGKLIFERPDGAELAYYLGTHPEVQEALIESTDILGNYKDLPSLEAAAAKNPQLAMELGRKLALAEVELNRISASLKSTAVPQKEKLKHQPQPTSEVSVEPQGSAIEDPLAAAIKSGDQDSYNRIANQRAREGALL